MALQDGSNPARDAANEAGDFIGALLEPETLAAFTETAIGWGLKALAALVVFFIGMRIAAWAKARTVNAVLRAPNLDETLAKFFGSLVYYLVVAFVVIAVLSMFGIQTTGLAALIGAAGLAIGLALQGTLGHLASGVMLLAFRPFKLGDYVEAAARAARSRKSRSSRPNWRRRTTSRRSCPTATSGPAPSPITPPTIYAASTSSWGSPMKTISTRR